MFNEIGHLQGAMLVESIVDAINRHAVERQYDWYIFWVAVASVIASVIAIGLSAYLNYRQTEIARAQKDISDEQTQISKKQTDIMEQQNRIALFEKRHELFLTFKGIMSYTTMVKQSLESGKVTGDLLKKNEEYKWKALHAYLSDDDREKNLDDIFKSDIKIDYKKSKLEFILQLKRLCTKIKAIVYVFDIDKEDKFNVELIAICILKATVNFQKNNSIDEFLDTIIALEELTLDKKVSQLQKKLESQLKLHDNLKD